MPGRYTIVVWILNVGGTDCITSYHHFDVNLLLASVLKLTLKYIWRLQLVHSHPHVVLETHSLWSGITCLRYSAEKVIFIHTGLIWTYFYNITEARQLIHHGRIKKPISAIWQHWNRQQAIHRPSAHCGHHYVLLSVHNLRFIEGKEASEGSEKEDKGGTEN